MTSRKNPRSSAWVTSSLTTTPSITIAKSFLPVDPVRPHEVLDLVVRLHRLAGVPPETLDDVVLDPAVVEVPVVYVSDLQLAAAGGLQLREHAPHGLVIKVDAGDCELAGRLIRLLDNVLDLPRAVEVGDAEVAQVLSVDLVGEHDSSSVCLLRESVNAST